MLKQPGGLFLYFGLRRWRPGPPHFLADLILVRFEISPKQLRKHPCLPVVLERIEPGVARAQQLRQNARTNRLGREPPKTGSGRKWDARLASSFRAARTSRRVTAKAMRRPWPRLPPVQPVLTSQTCEPCRSRRSCNIRE